MALDHNTLVAALDPIVRSVPTGSVDDPFPTLEMPWYRHRTEGGFEFGVRTEADWSRLVEHAFDAAASEPAVRAAVETIERALRHAWHTRPAPPIGGLWTVAERVFLGYCQLALPSSYASDAGVAGPSVVEEQIAKALKATEAFCAADAFDVVHVAPIAVVSVSEYEIAITGSLRLRSMNEDQRQDTWRRIGVPSTHAAALMSFDLAQVAAATARAEVSLSLTLVAVVIGRVVHGFAIFVPR